MSYPAHGL